MRLLPWRASRQARLLAEVQVEVECGATLEEAFAHHARDEEWLRPLVETTEQVAASYAALDADPSFAGELRQVFLAASRRPSFAAAPPPSTGRLRTAFAGVTVAAAVSTLGVMTYALVTADQAVPGDWNYTFKRMQEQVEYSLSHGKGRVDVQIRQTEARVYELEQLSSRRDLSAADLQKLEREARTLADVAKDHQLEESQRARLRGILEGANVVLEETKTRQPQLEPAVNTTRRTVDDAVAATGAGTVSTLSAPTPSPSPTSAAGTASSPAASDSSATPSPTTATGTQLAPVPTETPEATVTPIPSATPEQSPPASPSAEPTATASPEPTTTVRPQTAGTNEPTPAPAGTPADGDEGSP